MCNDFNISIHVYHNSNITKLCAQCASLLMKYSSSENSKITKLQHMFESFDQKNKSKQLRDKVDLDFSNLTFKNINDAMKYLNDIGFENIDISKYNDKIHISFYCDSTSGYKYSSLKDFMNRFDIPQFNAIFKNKVFNLIGKLKILPYFIYHNFYTLFPEINNMAKYIFNKREDIDIFEREMTYNDYINNGYLKNIFDLKCKQFKLKFPQSATEFRNINFIISQNIRDFKLPITFIQFKYILKLVQKDYSTIIDDILKDKYPNGFRLTYQIFLELYELQPELFNEDIEKYWGNNEDKNLDKKLENPDKNLDKKLENSDKNLNVNNENISNKDNLNINNENLNVNENNKNINVNVNNENINLDNNLNINLDKNENINVNNVNNENKNFENKFENYNPNIENVIKIFNEFHSIYPNSSFRGTKYHTNLMINRNQALHDFNSKHKIFIDDDDFTCGLEHYYHIYQLYANHIDNIYPIIKNKIINKLKMLNFIKYNNLIQQLSNLNKNELIKFRKIMYNYFESKIGNFNAIDRLIYLIYMKINMYNFPTMCMNFSYHIMEAHITVCADWSKIIPPYIPFNFITPQDTLCEDVMFSSINFTHLNYFDITKPIYYYFVEAHTNHWGTYENCSNFEKIHFLGYMNLIRPNYYKYIPVNIGRYYYKYDSIVEFENNFKNELRFVCDINRSFNIENIIKNYKNIDNWNNKLSKEYLHILYL